MAKPFREAFIEAVEGSGVSVAEVALKSGVSKEQLNKLKQRPGAKTNVDDAIKVAGYFGKTLDQFLEDDEALIRSEIVDLYNQLTDQERQMILGAAKGALASRDSGKQ